MGRIFISNAIMCSHKNAKIGDNENQMPIEKTFGNPFKEIDEIKNGFMSPQPFPPAQK